MISHPVLFEVERAPRMDRLHVLVRLLLLVAIGALGLGSVYWVLYLVPPLVVALLVSGSGRVRYLAESAPVVVRVMRWFAGAYAYLWLLTDTVPAGGEEGPVAFEVEIGGWPTMGSALKRLVTSLPALVLLVVLHRRRARALGGRRRLRPGRGADAGGDSRLPGAHAALPVPPRRVPRVDRGRLPVVRPVGAARAATALRVTG
jgi:hypothetical protein